MAFPPEVELPPNRKGSQEVPERLGTRLCVVHLFSLLLSDGGDFISEYQSHEYQVRPLTTGSKAILLAGEGRPSVGSAVMWGTS